MQRSLNSFTNYVRFPEVFPRIAHVETPVFRILKNILTLFILSKLLLWWVLPPSYQNTPYRKRGNLPCLNLTSPELFQICLYYVCNLYFHNIKVSAIFSSWLGRNKTHICDCIYHWLQQCSSIPSARLCSWMSHNFLAGRNTVTIYLALHPIFTERKS